jgi:IPT/TIG domain
MPTSAGQVTGFIVADVSAVYGGLSAICGSAGGEGQVNVFGLLGRFTVSASAARVVAGSELATGRRPLIRRLAVSTAALVGLPVLTLGLTAEPAAASRAGTITIFAGISSPYGIAAGPDGALWFTNNFNNSIGSITTAGTVTNYTGIGIGSPQAIAAGPDGAMWFTGVNSIGSITTAVTPKIISFTPTSGPVGTTVTITGHGLSGATVVAFNGTPATIVSDTATQIVTTVPTGATKGHISITTPAGTVTSIETFNVT